MKSKINFKAKLNIFISAFFLISLILPMIFLFKNIFYDKESFIGLVNLKNYITNPCMYISFKNSLKVSIISSIISIILSFIFCYGIERTNIKFKSIFNIIVELPIFTPTIALGLSLIYMFGSNGVLHKFICRDLYGEFGIIIGEVIYTFPISLLIFQVAFKTIDNKLYESCEVFGIKATKQFFLITLKNLRSSIVVAFSTCFALVISDFGIPKIIGGNFNVVSMDIYKYVTGQNNMNLGAVASLMLLVPTIICFIVKGRFQSKFLDGKKSNYKIFIKQSKIRDFFFYIYNGAISVFMILLYGTMILSTIVEKWPYNLKLTFKWFCSNDFENMGGTIINTLIISILTAVLGTVIAFLTAYLVENKENRYMKLKKLIKIIASSCIAIPGLSMGLAFILFYNHDLNPLNFLYGTYAILILVNIVHLFSMPFLLICEDLRRISGNFKDVCKVFHIEEGTFIYKVAMPMCKNSLLESICYFFINSINSTSAVIFLYTYNTKVLSVEIVNMYDTNYIYSSCALCVIMILFNVLFKVICRFLLKKYSYENKIKYVWK